MDRRDFLRFSVLSVAAGLTGAASSLNTVVQPDLLMMLGPDAVRAIGWQYRELVPDECQPEMLRAAILAGDVKRDFAAGRTIVLRGWVLSVTEARQCALFSLLSS